MLPPALQATTCARTLGGFKHPCFCAAKPWLNCTQDEEITVAHAWTTLLWSSGSSSPRNTVFSAVSTQQSPDMECTEEHHPRVHRFYPWLALLLSLQKSTWKNGMFTYHTLQTPYPQPSHAAISLAMFRPAERA